jgi:hypothetical protein
MIRPLLCRLAILAFVPAFYGADDRAMKPAVSDQRALSAEWWDTQITRAAPARAAPGHEWWRLITAINPACRIYSDGCQTCFRGQDSFECSNPGIACLGGGWSCMR